MKTVLSTEKLCHPPRKVVGESKVSCTVIMVLTRTLETTMETLLLPDTVIIVMRKRIWKDDIYDPETENDFKPLKRQNDQSVPLGHGVSMEVPCMR